MWLCGYFCTIFSCHWYGKCLKQKMKKKNHNFPIDIFHHRDRAEIKKEGEKLFLSRFLLCLTWNFLASLSPICPFEYAWFSKSNLNLFQRHTKATRKESFFLEQQKFFRNEGNYMQKGRDGRVQRKSLLNRGNQQMLHDRNSCLIVVFGCFPPRQPPKCFSAIIAPKDSWLIAF